MKRPLQKLNNKELATDIKSYIQTSHKFYSKKVPEVTTLAKRLREEYTLEKFYRVFTRLFNSGIQKERSLALHGLLSYDTECNPETWYFLKKKLKKIRNWDEIDSIARILGTIYLNYPEIEPEIVTLSNTLDPFQNRLALFATIPQIKQGNVTLAWRLLEAHVEDSHEKIQEAVGIVLREMSIKKPDITKRFITKHPEISDSAFLRATEHLKELRKERKVKNITQKNEKRWWFWSEPKPLRR